MILVTLVLFKLDLRPSTKVPQGHKNYKGHDKKACNALNSTKTLPRSTIKFRASKTLA
jgi:hypothetical protein